MLFAGKSGRGRARSGSSWNANATWIASANRRRWAITRSNVLGRLQGVYQAMADLRSPRGNWDDSPDRDLAYRYAAAILPAMAEVDMIYLVQEHSLADNLWVVDTLLTKALFLLCPEDELDAQRQRWQKFWEKEIQPLERADLPTWEHASLGYYARKKDVPGLRQALATLAKSGPTASRWLWEGPGSPARARRYLEMAGDPEWKTWKPEIVTPSGVYFVTVKQWDDYFAALCPPMPELWDYAGSARFPAQTTVTFPQDVVRYGTSARYMPEQAPIEPLCVADGELWLSAPGLVKQDLTNLHQDFRLYTARVSDLEKAGEVTAELLPVSWPARTVAPAHEGEKPPPLVVRCAAVDQGPQGPRVWIGTHYHGLACFSKENGHWQGRWFADEAGLPALCVVQAASCLHDGKAKMLLTLRKPHLGDPASLRDNAYLAILDPATAETTILLDSNARKNLWDQQWAAVGPNGQRVPLRQYRRDLWPDLDFKDVKQYVGIATDPSFAKGRQMWLSGQDAKTGRPRIWGADSNGIGELDADSLTPLPWQLKRRVASNLVLNNDQTQFLAGRPLGRSYLLSWTQESTPDLGGRVCSAGDEAVAWGVVPGWQTWKGYACVTAYRMAAKDQGEWSHNDRWYGPLKSPDNRGVSTIMPATPGKLYVTSNAGTMYVVSADEFIATAETRRQACTTAQWQEDYQRRLQQAGWTCVVRRQISDRKWPEALRTLDAVTDAKDADKVLLYRAGHGADGQAGTGGRQALRPDRRQSVVRSRGQGAGHDRSDPVAPRRRSMAGDARRGGPLLRHVSRTEAARQSGADARLVHEQRADETRGPEAHAANPFLEKGRPQVTTLRCARVATGFLLAAALVGGTPRLVAETPAAASSGSRAASEPICVAVIEPEVSAAGPQTQRNALAGALDALLAESLGHERGFALVDRQALDKVLAEKALGAAGLAKVAPDEVAAPLRPFWAAGVLVCSEIDAKSGAVIVEAVSAQTGQVLAGIYAKAKIASAGDLAAAIGPKMDAFAREIGVGVARMRGKPLLEVSGEIASGTSRLAWMVDDLSEAAGARVAAEGKVVPLSPRRPIVTKEERLLRVMGLANAREGDAAAGLSPTPEMRLSFELRDSAKTGVSFEKTPICLTLSLRRGDQPASQTQIDGEVGQWESCRDKAIAWLAGQLSAGGGATAPAANDDEERAKQLAKEELAAVAQWTSLEYYKQKDLSLAIRVRIARHALRAAHLDPTSEEATYLTACYVDALCPREGKDGDELSLAAIDRAMIELQRYLDRFPQRNIEHHLAVFSHAGFVSNKAAWNLAGGSGEKDAILRVPDLRQYPYLRFYVRTCADHGYLGKVDPRYNNGNAFSAFSFNLLNRLVPCIPDDKVNEEYEYWRTFYATKVAKFVAAMRGRSSTDFLNTRPAPWDLIDAAFQARKKNPKGVREAFERLAKEFPRGQTHIWGGDQWTPLRTPMFLQAAGDPDWKTWQPGFTAPQAIEIGLDEMTRFMQGLCGQSLGPWDTSHAAPLPAVGIVAPEAVKATGRQNGSTRGEVESLFMAGNDLWLITPASAVGNGRERNRLFAAGMKPAEGGKIVLDPAEIPWPAYDPKDKQPPSGPPIFEPVASSNATARPRSGSGRGPTGWRDSTRPPAAGPRGGIPSATAFRPTPSRESPVAEAATSGSSCWSSSTRGVTFQPDGSGKANRPTYVWTLNPQTNEVKLLLDGGKLAKPLTGPLAAVTKDGKLLPLDLVGRPGFELDIDRIESFRPSGIASSAAHDLIRDAAGKLRLLHVRWDAGPDGDFDRLDEISLDTLQPLPTSLGRSGGRYSVFPFPETQWIFGRIYWRFGGFVTLSGGWPAVDAVFAQGRGQYLWMGYRGADAYVGTERWLVAYRPAPLGAKDWAAKDQWVGPFRLPDNGTIARMAPYGDDGLLLTTNQGMYLVDCPQAISQAIAQGRACSTEQWRSQHQERALAAGWKTLVPMLIESQKWDEALRLIETELQRATAAGATAKSTIAPGVTAIHASSPQTQLNLWHAHLLACKGDLAGAIRMYDQTAQQAAADRDQPAEVFARMNQLVVLFHAERHQEMLDLCADQRPLPANRAAARRRPAVLVLERSPQEARRRPAGNRPAREPGQRPVNGLLSVRRLCGSKDSEPGRVGPKTGATRRGCERGCCSTPRASQTSPRRPCAALQSTPFAS